VSTSNTLSLSALEYLVHLDVDLVPNDLASIEIAIVDDTATRTVEVSKLPRLWRTYPAPEFLADIGDEWHDQGKDLLLSVPSAVIPNERNVLINPTHPDFARSVRIIKSESFAFDDRLLNGRRRPAFTTQSNEGVAWESSNF
jgi:RES domain-containing protein